ncbi:MAG: sugar phosphate isomerase/epimerase family protein [Blastocatellia bacterium]
MKFGTTLFSHTLEWLSGGFTLDEMLSRIHAYAIGPGLEIIGFQTIRHFPHISDEFARELRELMDRYELVPTCLGANIDVALRRDRYLTTDETVEYVAAQIAAAQKLGFPVLRVQMTAKPEVMRQLAPIAEKAHVKLGMELHSPYANHHPAVVALRELYEEMDSPALGYIPDFGTTMRDLPPGLLDSFRHEGMPETLIELIQEIWHADAPTPEKFAQVAMRATALGATPQQLGRLNMTLSMFCKQSPEQWLEVMPRVVHMHGKFYGFDENGDEPSVDCAALMRVFRDGGYCGTMSSEWEGHAYTDEFSSFAMVKQHQALCRRGWNH